MDYGQRGGYGNGGGRQLGNCYKCGMRGHWAKSCYAGRRGGRGGGRY